MRGDGAVGSAVASHARVASKGGFELWLGPIAIFLDKQIRINLSYLKNRIQLKTHKERLFRPMFEMHRQDLRPEISVHGH